MGTYNSAIPTDVGLAMVAQAISGGQAVTFTKLRTSSYQYPSGTDYSALTSLISVQQTVDITYASTADPKNVKVNATVTNAGVNSAYTIQNIGVYAQIGSSTETLFAVIPATVGDVVPVYSDTTRVSYIFSITIAVGTATGLTVNVTTAGMASVLDLQDTENDIIEMLTPTIASSQVVESASGDVATFTDGANGAPLQSVKVTISPEQDLNGQDAPYPPGGSKNLLNPDVIEVGAYTALGNPNEDGNLAYRRFAISLPAGTYTFSTTLTNAFIIRYLINNVQYYIRYTGQSYTITLTEASELKLTFRNVDTTEITEDFTCQIEEGSTATDYVPYSNVCPVIGMDSVSVMRSGKNMLYISTSSGSSGGITFTKDPVQGTVVLNGETSTTPFSNLDFKSGVCGYPKGVPLRLSGVAPGVVVRFCYNTKASSVTVNLAVATQSNPDVEFVIPEQAYSGWVRVVAGSTSMVYDNVVITPMVRIASDADSTFAVGVPQKYTTSLNGTVYSGTVDVVTGSLTVDSASAEIDGSAEWAMYEEGKFYVSNVTNDAKESTTGYLSNQYLFEGNGSTGSTSVTTDKRFYGQLQYNRIWVYDSKYTTLEDFKAAMSAVPLQVVYPINTPITVQITPKLIRSLFGINNVWSDSSAVDVDYVADLKTYIDRKIAEATA